MYAWFHYGIFKYGYLADIQRPVPTRDSQENSCYFLPDSLIPGTHGT
jgi:hypothetical protein